MSLQEKQRILKAFAKTLDDRALAPEDTVYVPFLLGPSDPIAYLVTEITWRETAGINFLSGQRGVGKSTEMQRLRRMLEQEGCVTFFCDMADHLDLRSPIDVTDFLLALVTALSAEVEKRYQANALTESFWRQMVQFLETEVKIQEISFGVSGTKVKASLKENPGLRQRIRERMAGHVASFIRQIQQFAIDVVMLVQGDRKEHAKIVLLVDSIEQIGGDRENAKSIFNSVEKVFSLPAQWLRFPFHTVYTVPPWLPILAPGLAPPFGSAHKLQGIHVYKTRSRTPDQRGLEVMRWIVSRRFPEWKKVFREDQLDRIALSTAGDIGQFFYLIKSCLILERNACEGLPISDKILDRAEDILRDRMPVVKEDERWLRRIASTYESGVLTVEQLPRLAHFLDAKLVREYRNGKDWYDIHPLLRKVIR